MATSDNDSSDIKVLTWREAVRARPGMYIGDAASYGLGHMLLEVVGNSLDEYLARAATRITVDLAEDGWARVEDDGRGLLLEGSQRGVPNVRRIFMATHVGATLDGHHPHIHVTPRLHGVGVAVVNALSARLEVETRRDGTAWRVAFEQGEVAEPLESLGPTTARGTVIRYLPDPSIFKDNRLNLPSLEEKFADWGYLCPTLDLRLQGRSMQQPRGMAGMVEALAGQALVPESLLAFAGTIDDVEVELAVGWRRNSTAPAVQSFVNYNRTTSGSHAEGVLAALTARVSDELLQGVVAVVHVGLLDPRFKGPTKAVLEVEAARSAVETALTKALASSSWWTNAGR